MSMSIPTSVFSSSTLKIPYFPRLINQTHKAKTPLSSSLIRTQPFTSKHTHQRFGNYWFTTKRLRFCVNAENEEGESKNVGGVGDDGEVTGSNSTLPDRFRYLTKEAPDPPLIWPWFVALGFLIYTWRAVLFELGNWKKAAFAIVGFIGYLLKLALAVTFRFIGDPITSLIRCIETAIYSVQSFYFGIIRHAPIPELTTIIVLASAVLAIAEAAVPNSVHTQSHLLTISGLIGYAAVKSYISEPVFWTLLLGLYAFSKLVKKRDNVTSTLPVAAALAAVGEPWVRVLAIISYSALAVSQYTKRQSQGKNEVDDAITSSPVPLPLLGVSLAIGIRLAAKWAGYRHLTWMIV